MRTFTYQDEDKVRFHVQVSADKVIGGTGKIVCCSHRVPGLGDMYIVVADDPKGCGLMTEDYPFSAVIVAEGAIEPA